MKRIHKTAFLHFENGPSFKGKLSLPEKKLTLFESQGIWGEVAYTSAMTGYQETLTDPSYLGQHILFASSHIGNYPANEKQNQSSKIHASSAIARSFSENEWLEQSEIPLLSDLDTRALSLFVTTKAKSLKTVISATEAAPSTQEFSQSKLFCSDLDLVSQEGPEWLRKGKNPIVLINYGVKKAIIDYLDDGHTPLVTLPHTSSFEDIQNYNPRMVFLSNGPGDPRLYTEQVEVVKQLIASDFPLRAICLGHQLICAALGAKIEKLPFGHRGINHPVLNQETGKVLITSQNHGYVVSKNWSG